MRPDLAFSLVVGTIACLLSLGAGFPLLGFLRSHGIGKKIRVEGPSSHIVKMGTPTMGGLIICGTVLVVTLLTSLLVYGESGRSILLPLTVLVASAAIGAVDDRLSVMESRGGQGLRARAKFGVLAVIATGAGIALWHPAILGMDFVYLPTVAERIHLPWFIYIPLAVVAILGSANAVNLTDGLDSLAGWTAIWAFLAYAVISTLYGQTFLVTFCVTVVGALLGFLWFNAHPAQVFMGDTGSLALGATLATVALMTGQVLLLPVIGAVFVAEALSVILQVAYFKMTGGKRLFRMAPLHHHFELMGWSETHVAQRFTLVSVLALLLGVALALV